MKLYFGSCIINELIYGISIPSFKILTLHKILVIFPKDKLFDKCATSYLNHFMFSYLSSSFILEDIYLISALDPISY